MPYDPQVGAYSKLSLPSRERRRRRLPAKRNLFARGPIPKELITRCRRAHREALTLLLCVKIEADTLGSPVVVAARLARSIGMHPKTCTRVLAALEGGGLIEVERAPGKAPRVWLDCRLFEV